MSVRVRRFAPRDGEAVAHLWRECFPHDPARNNPEDLIARKLARDPDLFWVATDAMDVVGAAMGGYDGVRGWLYHVAVSPERRHEGIGRALVERALAEFEAIGCPKVNLQVRASNPDVAAFYEALGFAPDDVASYGYLMPGAGG